MMAGPYNRGLEQLIGAKNLENMLEKNVTDK